MPTTSRPFTHPGSKRSRATRCLLHAKGLDDAPVGVPHDDVTDHFAFRATNYYTALIDWRDPLDPIRKLIVPSRREAEEFGRLDAANEVADTVAAGLQHKYADTALLLVTDQCAGFCRYCFRKRLFSDDNRETGRDVRPALDYIAAHAEITDVVLSGGDPLTLRTGRLTEIVEGILAIPHVRTVRIGSKVPAFDPGRIIDDARLLDVVRRIVSSGRSAYLMTHFDHPRELTAEARAAVAAFRAAGATCLNQCPVTAGVNDDADVLAELFQACTDAGCPQYYAFQCRPTTGNAPFIVPLVRAFGLVEAARSRVSGLSRRLRFCLSDESGKVEIVGLDDRRIYARFHRAQCSENNGRMVVYDRDDAAFWIDGLTAAAG